MKKIYFLAVAMLLLCIAKSQNVGIGTVTPLNKLDIAGGVLIRGANNNALGSPVSAVEFAVGRQPNGTMVGTQTTADIAFEYGGGGFRHYIMTRHFSGAGSHFNAMDFYINNSPGSTGSSAPGTGNVNPMSLTAIGVGINTNAPASLLHVIGAEWGSNPVIFENTIAGNAGPTLRFAGSNNIFDIIGSTGSGAVPSAGSFGIWDNNSGAFRMVIRPNGNVGLGTYAPLQKLHVVHATNTGGMVIQNSTGGTGAVTNLYMATYSDFVAGIIRPGAGISAVDDGTFSAHMTFATKLPGADANALTERVRITSLGNVGIATASPHNRLHVVHTSNADGISIQNVTAGTGTATGLYMSTYPDVVAGTSRPGAGISAVDDGIFSDHLAFSTKLPGADANSLTERMRITDFGNVGIATNGPLYKLHLIHTSASDGMIIQNITAGAGNAANIFLSTYGDVVAGVSRPGARVSAVDDGVFSDHITFATKIPGADVNLLTERMRISSAGNVGIGTSSPGSLLEVGAPVGGLIPELRISSFNAGFASAQVSFYSDRGSPFEWRPAYLISQDGSPGNYGGRLDFVTNGIGPSNKLGSVIAMTVYNGKVGVGTTSPNASAELDVSSITSGFLPPRMTTTQRNAIATPAAGLMVYNTDMGCPNYYNGSGWYANCGTSANGGAVFTYSGSIVTWTVPAGVYQIIVEAKGASGGYNSLQGGTGGLGADVKGAFNVAPGQVLSILVGQSPGNWNSSNNSYPAGGGATYVALGAAYASSTAWLVAGGGGAGYSTTGGNAGLAVTSGAGTGGTATACGGGGGGFTGNGATDASNGTGTNAQGGRSFVNGGAGAIYTGVSGSYSYQTGGFGGGATADYNASCNTQAGAAGGFIGGNGQSSVGVVVSGNGGGSYILSTATLQLNTINNTGNGSVVISY